MCHTEEPVQVQLVDSFGQTAYLLVAVILRLVIYLGTPIAHRQRSSLPAGIVVALCIVGVSYQEGCVNGLCRAGLIGKISLDDGFDFLSGAIQGILGAGGIIVDSLHLAEVNVGIGLLRCINVGLQGLCQSIELALHEPVLIVCVLHQSPVNGHSLGNDSCGPKRCGAIVRLDTNVHLLAISLFVKGALGRLCRVEAHLVTVPLCRPHVVATVGAVVYQIVASDEHVVPSLCVIGPVTYHIALAIPLRLVGIKVRTEIYLVSFGSLRGLCAPIVARCVEEVTRLAVQVVHLSAGILTGLQISGSHGNGLLSLGLQAQRNHHHGRKKVTSSHNRMFFG